MFKTVKKYETADGSLFDTPQQAQNHARTLLHLKIQSPQVYKRVLGIKHKLDKSNKLLCDLLRSIQRENERNDDDD